MRRSALAAGLLAIGLALTGCGGVDRNAEVGKWLTQHDAVGHSYDVRCDKTPSAESVALGEPATPCSWYNGETQGWVCAHFDGSSHLLRVERASIPGQCG